MVKKITDFPLYRWRYILGYILLGLMGLGLLLIAFLYAPGGISSDEKKSVIATSQLSFQAISPRMIIDAPYHVLQWLSIRTFGLSDFSIKLPSLLIALLTVVGMVGLLGSWFRRNVAILAAIIVVTTGHFLFLAQNGTPEIMMVFWPVWILFAALRLSRRRRFEGLWKVVLFGSIALSLYTPFTVYMLLALLTAALFHPHLRYIIRTMTPWKVIVALVLAFALLTPLGYALTSDHSIAKALIGWPANMPNILSNLRTLAAEYGNFMKPGGGVLTTPIYGLGCILLALLGILRFFTTKYTVRGYILMAWIILLLPVMLIDPTVVDVTFVPMIFLVAMGLDWLFRRWYMLFPFNPYARIAGLIPLTVLLAGIVVSGVTRYTDGMLYDPQKARAFSQDLSIVNQQLIAQRDQPFTLVASSADQPFYHSLEKYNSRIKVTTTPPKTYQTLLVSRDADRTPPAEQPAQILTSDKSQYADRFYLYQK